MSDLNLNKFTYSMIAPGFIKDMEDLFVRQTSQGLMRINDVLDHQRACFVMSFVSYLSNNHETAKLATEKNQFDGVGYYFYP